MTGQKRKWTTGLTSRPKASTASDEYKAMDVPYSQSSQPTSSQQDPFPQLASSQLDESNLTDKTLSELSDGEKSEWRKYTDPKRFFEFVGWDQKYLDAFLSYYRYNLAYESFEDWLVSSAANEIMILRNNLRGNMTDNINWPDWPEQLDALKMKNSSTADDMVFTWIELKKIDFALPYSPEHFRDAANQLTVMLPKVKHIQTQVLDAVRAFFTGENLSLDGFRASDAICEKLAKFHRHYKPESHLAPYTSLVGPSGIGKSFMVQQLSVYHGIYVVYVSLARKDSTGFPGRSEIADKIPTAPNRKLLENFWKVFITASLVEAEACKTVGITPGGFYNLQTKNAYGSYRKDFAARVEKLFNVYCRFKPANCDEELGAYVNGHLSSSHGSMFVWCQELEVNRDNHGPMRPEAAGPRRDPKAILCFDEARELIDHEEAQSFRSLRQALRERYVRTKKQCEKLPRGEFFGLFLDTTSRVANFSPPVRLDHSQKVIDPMGHSRKLLPPIYEIQTMDVFAPPPTAKEEEYGSPEWVLQLFRFGRPLWGARCLAQKSPDILVDDLLSLAFQKITGDSPVKRLALLSYRTQLYITNNHLADEMVSGCLRYIAYINRGRDLMMTLHPSEPILAYVAASSMTDPSTRLDVLRCLLSNCLEGKLTNTGDVGEMVSSLLLLFAFDEKQFAEPGAWPGPILLKDFMEALFGSNLCEEIAQRMGTDAEMERLWKTGMIFFNHFTNLKCPPTLQTLEDAFRRGAAFFLPPGFPGADIIIPVRIPGLDRMSFCAVQVKNRKHDSFTGSLKSKAAASFKKAVDELKWSQGHIGVMMCLWHKSSTMDTNLGILLPEIHEKRGMGTRQIPRHVDSSSSSGTIHCKWPKNGKRLVILAMGMDESVYPSINLCQGERTEDSSQVLTLLKRLLDCIPGFSYPDGVDEDYIRRAMPLN